MKCDMWINPLRLKILSIDGLSFVWCLGAEPQRQHSERSTVICSRRSNSGEVIVQGVAIV